MTKKSGGPAMFRVLFLLLFLMSGAAFAQTQENPKPVKIDEFETATNGYVKMKMDYFYVELNNNPAAQGYIINYGTDREIAIRRKQISVSVAWRKFDGTRITIVDGGFREGVKSELWIVPPGADNPLPSSTAEKFDEFEKIPDEDLSARLDNLYVSLGNKPNSYGYILNFGSPKVVAAREQRIRKYLVMKKFVLSKVIFKNAGSDNGGRTEIWIIQANESKESRTKIWIVPPGAKPPAQ
jgi:hypothetical protein